MTVAIRPNEKHGQLTFRRLLASKGGKRYVECQCDCGQVWQGRYDAWRCGNSKTCGCGVTKAKIKHGQWGTPVYWCWHGMMQRCFNPKHKHYKSYGGKGITVCKSWQNFTSFFKDMGPRPFPSAEIDRRNTRRGYAPSNCRWSTRRSNCQNMLKSRVWVIDGIDYPSCHVAAEHLGVSSTTIRAWCNGVPLRRGRKAVAPKPNCKSRPRYAA